MPMGSSDRRAEREFWRLAWPASAEGLIVTLLLAVNLLMVSGLGTSATSAVGISAQPRMLLLCVSRSFAVAVSALIATRYGQGKIDTLNSCLKQAFVVITAVSFLFLLLSLALLEPILRLAGAKDDYMAMALDYGKPAMASLFFLSLSTILNAGLLGIGRTRAIMVASVAGNLCSAVLGGALIYGWGPLSPLGVAGAGMGALAGAFLSFLITLAVLLDPQCTVTLRGRFGWRLRREELSALRQIFTGAFAEQGVERAGMFLSSRMTAELGTLPFAVHTICMNLCDLYYSFAQGMGKASLVFAGQSLGAGNPRAFSETARAGRRIGFFLSAAACIAYALFRIPLIAVYEPSTEALSLGGEIMLFVAVVSFPEAHAHICAGTLRGAGKTRFVAVYSLISIAVLRPILTWAFCFPLGLGLHGAWAALLLDQTIRAVCASAGVFRVGRALKSNKL